MGVEIVRENWCVRKLLPHERRQMVCKDNLLDTISG
jgi:hypothetical protein